MLPSNVEIRFMPEVRHAWLRELTGADERSVSDVSTASAIALLDRLLLERPGPVARQVRQEG